MTAVDKSDRIAWFKTLGFGLFVHWGPYSVLGRGEWALHDERIPLDEYDEVCREFDASRFDADEWVSLAKSAGMGYIMLTAKHGDGYCLFDTAASARNSVKGTPGRDLVAEYVAACRRGGLGVGLYYSLTDWYDSYRRFGAYICTSAMQSAQDEVAARSWAEVVATKKAQIRELLTNYGPIDLLWFDDPPKVPEAYDAVGLAQLASELQPKCLVNSRGGLPGDFDISEERLVYRPKERPWEVCMPMAIRWGRHAGDTDYKSVATVLRMLRLSVTNGGNFLLNTGPDHHGTMQPQQADMLEAIGEWLRVHRTSIYGARPVGVGHAEWGEVATWDGEYLHVHVDRWMGSSWTFSGLENRVISARLLGTGESVGFRQSSPARLTFLDLPDNPPNPHLNVISLAIEGEPVIRPWLEF